MDTSGDSTRRWREIHQYPDVMLCQISHYVDHEDINREDEAKRKFGESGTFFLAAHSCAPNNDKQFNLRAAKLFIRAHEWAKAGDIYFAVNDLHTAVECFMKGKKYDSAARVHERLSIYGSLLVQFFIVIIL